MRPKADPSPEITLRQAAASHLADHLVRNKRLMARCEELAGARRGDRIAALNAAARLMRADAGMLSMLARVAQIESVHRTIVDKFAGLTPHGTGLNSNLSEEEQEKVQEKLWRLMNEHVENAIAARTSDPPKDDRIARILRDYDAKEQRDAKQ